MEFITLKTLLRKDSILAMVKMYLPGVIFLLLMAAFSLLNDFHFSYLSRDPVQILDAKPYIGMVSNVGILLWCATAAILFYSARLSSLAGKPRIQTNFLLSSGLITLLMLIDDLFLFHDIIFPEYFHIDENVFFVFYGLSVIALIYFFRKLIINTDYIFLVLSFGLLGTSAVSDYLIVLGFASNYSMVIEDVLKFMGIISWFSYYIRTAFYFNKKV
jgi:hypothetical protein